MSDAMLLNAIAYRPIDSRFLRWLAMMDKKYFKILSTQKTWVPLRQYAATLRKRNTEYREVKLRFFELNQT